jgi:hypothetical protein
MSAARKCRNNETAISIRDGITRFPGSRKLLVYLAELFGPAIIAGAGKLYASAIVNPRENSWI